MLTVFVVVAIIYFVNAEIQKSGAEITEIIHSVKWERLIISVLLLCLYFLLSSIGLRYLLNNQSNARVLSISKSFGILNISGLIKYLPGKVWSYAIMFYALNDIGFPMAKAVLDSLIHLILTVATPFLLMLPVTVFLFFSHFSLLIKLSMILLGVCLYIFCLFIFPFLLKIFVSLINRFKKEPIIYSPISRSLVLNTQIIILAGYIAYILAIMMIINSINMNLHFLDVLQTAIICLFATTIGFLAIIVPGGIGIQESLIYFFANINQTDPAFSLILPIVVRMVSIVSDLIVGLVSLWIIRSVLGRVFAFRRD
jgi:uncharacterized membrane protein YbhN (UPF0104 family)